MRRESQVLTRYGCINLFSGLDGGLGGEMKTAKLWQDKYSEYYIILQDRRRRRGNKLRMV